MRLRIPALFAAAATATAVAVAMMPQPEMPKAGVAAAMETAVIQPGRFAYRVPGEFLRAGRPVDGPVVERRMRRPVEIMAYQVSVAEYAACVADGVCRPPDGMPHVGDIPVTGVNYGDAVRYAEWLSATTGDDWRLPSDEEWSFAAAERFGDDAVGLATTVPTRPRAGSRPIATAATRTGMQR